MSDSAVPSFAALPHGMQLALDQAWSSILGGSLGIGAAALDPDGAVIATGRNRILEDDPGDDVLAGTSVAHAEMNVLAKLRYREHESLHLFTTLQPCVQCLGAIRLSAVASVTVLAPDPLFRGVEAMRDLTPFLARRWPEITQREPDEWSAFALLYPTHHMRDHPTLSEQWLRTLPTVHEAVRRIEADRTFDGAESVADAAARVWSELGSCVDEIVALATGA